MMADVPNIGSSIGTNRQRAGPTDAGDTTRESLEGKTGSAKRNVNVS